MGTVVSDANPLLPPASPSLKDGVSGPFSDSGYHTYESSTSLFEKIRATQNSVKPIPLSGRKAVLSAIKQMRQPINGLFATNKGKSATGNFGGDRLNTLSILTSSAADVENADDATSTTIVSESAPPSDMLGNKETEPSSSSSSSSFTPSNLGHRAAGHIWSQFSSSKEDYKESGKYHNIKDIVKLSQMSAIIKIQRRSVWSINHI
jgi:hypothetical protein